MLTTLLVTTILSIILGASAQKPFMNEGFNLGLVKEQIGEIMIVCGDNPTTCECSNGRTLNGEEFFPAIFGCSPKSCVCPNGLTVENLDEIEPDSDLTTDKFMTMMSIGNFMEHWSKIGEMFDTFCDGSAPTSCDCENGDEITSFKKKVTKLGICRPQTCKCADGSSLEVPDIMRYSFLSQMEDMCEVDYCSCTTSSITMIPPFESVAQIEECSPDTCTCKDGTIKELPQLPELDNNIIDSLEEQGVKRLRKFLNLCDGALPSFCDCIKRKEPLTSFDDKEEMKKCYPNNCTCLDGSIKPAPPKRGAFNRLIIDLENKIGKSEMDKMTVFYEGKYSKFVPGFGNPAFGNGNVPPGPPPFLEGGPPFGSDQIPDFVKKFQN